MADIKLTFRPGFDWRRLAWGGPMSPMRALCSYCHGKLPEVPLIMWSKDSHCIQLCDDCVERWVITEGTS